MFEKGRGLVDRESRRSCVHGSWRAPEFPQPHFITTSSSFSKRIFSVLQIPLILWLSVFDVQLSGTYAGRAKISSPFPLNLSRQSRCGSPFTTLRSYAIQSRKRGCAVATSTPWPGLLSRRL